MVDIIEQRRLYATSSTQVERRLLQCAAAPGDTFVAYWVGVAESPTSDEITQIAAAILEETKQDKGTMIILA